MKHMAMLVVGMVVACSSAVPTESNQATLCDEAGAHESGAGAPAVVEQATIGGEAGQAASVEAGAAGAGGEAGALATGGEAGAGPELPVIVLFVAGQSNAEGMSTDSVPGGVPDATIPEFQFSFGKAKALQQEAFLSVAPAFDGTLSHELCAAKALQAAGRRVAVIKITHGGTYISQWDPTGPGVPYVKKFELAVSLLAKEFPSGTAFDFRWVWDQGENEAKLGDPEVTAAWPGRLAALRAAFEGVAKQPLDPYIVITWSPRYKKASMDAVRAVQTSIASPGHAIDSYGSAFGADMIHRTGAADCLIGQAYAEKILESGPWN